MSNLAQQLESLLFALGRPLSRADAVRHLKTEAAALDAAAAELADPARGIVLVDDGQMLELRVAEAAAPLVEAVRKDEYAQSTGRAGLEALAAVLYRGPLTRAEVDFIRGVNSSQTLRTLTMRGLLRKVPNPKDERSFLYEPTTELLASLSVTRPQDLPDYAQVRAKLSELEAAYRARDTNEQTQ